MKNNGECRSSEVAWWRLTVRQRLCAIAYIISAVAGPKLLVVLNVASESVDVQREFRVYRCKLIP